MALTDAAGDNLAQLALVLVTLIFTPLALVVVVALLKGYHMDLKLWKFHHRKDDDHNGDQ